MKQPTKQIAFIRELCKHKTDKEIVEAEDNFRSYVAVIERICRRLEEEERECLSDQ